MQAFCECNFTYSASFEICMKTCTMCAVALLLLVIVSILLTWSSFHLQFPLHRLVGSQRTKVCELVSGSTGSRRSRGLWGPGVCGVHGSVGSRSVWVPGVCGVQGSVGSRGL